MDRTQCNLILWRIALLGTLAMNEAPVRLVPPLLRMGRGGKGEGYSINDGEGGYSTSVYNNCCLVLVQELGMPLTTHYLLFHHDLHYLSLCLSLVFILSSASQKRKIYSWSFWLKNLQLLLLLLLSLLLTEGKILKILPNPKPCLIQYIFKKSPLQLWLFSPAVLLLIRKALLLFCRRRNLYKWSGHHACVSCSVPRLLTDLELQHGHTGGTFSNSLHKQNASSEVRSHKNILSSLNMPRVLSQRSTLTKIYISSLNVLHVLSQTSALPHCWSLWNFKCFLRGPRWLAWN